jgi:hypothetical protein
MKNINKYTKAELINKFKSLQQENNKSNAVNLLETILKFKNIILKITLITFIIKWIRKYSLVVKLWHIFSVIGSGLLSFSLIDIYYWDVLSWIKDTSIWKWYAEVFYSFSKTESTPSKSTIDMTETNTNITNETQNKNNWGNRQINRNINEEIINKENISNPENISNTDSKLFYYSIVATGVIITVSLGWYYSEEIKTGVVSLYDWFLSFRSGGPGSGGGNNTTGSATPTGTNIPAIENNSPKNPPIELIDKTIDEGKGRVLTSPSLENLNNQAQETWKDFSIMVDNSSPSSPSESVSSSSTITPASIQTNTPSSYPTIDETVANFIQRNWTKRFPEEIQLRIKYIETNLKSDLNLNERMKLSEYFAQIISEYNKDVESYNLMKNNPNINELDLFKKSSYYFREWIIENKNQILPDSTSIIELGSDKDSPKILSLDIF